MTTVPSRSEEQREGHRTRPFAMSDRVVSKPWGQTVDLS